jgi:flagellin
MALRVNHNVAAINTQRNLMKTSFDLSKSLQKLSSGLRINTAADDPAGLVISEQLRAQVSGLKMAVRNSQEASNLVGITEGALVEINDILNSIRALTLHASNTGVVGSDQIAADQAEVDNAVQSIQRIVETTRYAGERIFSTVTDISRTFHIGEGTDSGDEVALTFVKLGTSTGGGLSQLHLIQGGSAIQLSGHAESAVGVIDDAISKVSGLRGKLGAFQKNTLQTNINSLGVAIENVTATESYIRDANMAEETSEYTKSMILVQAGTAVLAQANLVSQNVLRLLA